MHEKLHLCVGFYPDGTYVTNTVSNEKLRANVEYNRKNRPGRYYFVDGEYVCGQHFTAEYHKQFIETCKSRIVSLNLQPGVTESRIFR